MKKLFVFLCVFFATNAFGQFTATDGNERGSLKWSYIETPLYKVIYPRGLDSLARRYAIELERVAPAVSYSSGWKIHENIGGKYPVVLHSYYASSNGSVAWPPHRMELYTTPDAYAPESLPWDRHLTIHESRHLAQIQYATAYPFTWGKYLIGDLSTAVLSGLYCGSPFFEGDAVYAETALTKAGRGRTADFLEHYRVNLEKGNNYSLDKWRFGSINDYTPDFYKMSYVYYAGLRSYYKQYDFNKKYFQTILDYNGVAIIINNKMARKVAGKKYRPLFLDITANLEKEWHKDEISRGPYMPSEKFSAIKGRYTDFTGLEFMGDELVAIRRGLSKTGALVRFENDGNSKIISHFASETSMPKYSFFTKKLYWSETIPNLRWEQESSSDIRYTDLSGKMHSLTHGQRYYNPVPCGDKLAVVWYPYEGGSAVRVLDINSGEVLETYKAPDGLQVVEVAWIGDDLFVSGITLDGFSLYQVTNSPSLRTERSVVRQSQSQNYKQLLPSVHTKVKQLWTYDDKIMFTCDRTSVNELYSLDPKTKQLLQLTNTPHGAADFIIKDKTLYYSHLEPEGRYVSTTKLEELKAKEVSFEDIAEFPIAKDLAEGEKVKIDENVKIEISEPQNYNRLSNAFRLHSWVPVYFSYDNISNISFDTIFQTVGIGATVFSQNTLGNSYGYAAYHLNPEKPKWRHGAEVSYTYSGLYPILEAKVKYNDRDTYNYGLRSSAGDPVIGSLSGLHLEKPHLNASLRAYIPFNLSSGGWHKGIIPSLTYNFSNDKFYSMNGKSAYMSYITASLRAYIMEPLSFARTYPRFGVGAELGFAMRPELKNVLSGGAYAYLYGYLPGIGEIQSMKLTAMYQRQNKTGYFDERYFDVVPSGFKSSIGSALSSYTNAAKFTINYSIPMIPIEWSLLGIVYFQNLELVPHFDLSIFRDSKYKDANLWSAGAALLLRIGSSKKATKVGVRADYLGGNDIYTRLKNAKYIEKDYKIALVFNFAI